MITKMMIGKPKLSVKHIEYLRKDNEHISDLEYLRMKETTVYKDTKNPIYLGGYLNIQCRKQGYGEISESEQNQLIERTFNEIIEENKTVIPANGVGIRHFTFSPDPKKMKHLSKAEQEKLIIKATRETMKKFKDTFYKGDQLGFVFSVHKDKAHMHSHVYLSTITKNGDYISMNAGLYKKGGGYINEKTITDKLNYLKTASKNSFDKEINRTLNQEKGHDKSHLKNKLKTPTKRPKKETFKDRFAKKAARRLRSDQGLKEYEHEINKQHNR
jgi:hypothetical protein